MLSAPPFERMYSSWGDCWSTHPTRNRKPAKHHTNQPIPTWQIRRQTQFIIIPRYITCIPKNLFLSYSSSSWLDIKTVLVVFLSSPSNPPSHTQLPRLSCSHWIWAHSVSSHSRMVARVASLSWLSVFNFCSNSASGIYMYWTCGIRKRVRLGTGWFCSPVHSSSQNQIIE